MGPNINIVLAGIGGYGSNYVRSLLRREKEGRIRMIALVDPGAENSPDYPLVADRPIYADLGECLTRNPADLVILSSPIQYHAEQIMMALDHGAHVLCEKPLCATRQQGLELIEAQKVSGRQVGIGYQWSYSLAIQQARNDIRSGLYGDPVSLRTRVYWPRSQAYFSRNKWAGRLYADDGRPVFDSVLNNATAHYLHNMLFFLGEGVYDAAIPERIEARLMRAYTIETFDTALVCMEKDLPGGRTAKLAIAVSHCPENQLGPDLDYQYTEGRLLTRDGHMIGIRHIGDQSEVTVDYGPITSADPVAEKVDALIAAAEGDERMPCDVTTAFAQTAVVSAVHEQTEIETATKSCIRRSNR
ncbi:MAG: Gfo/Idh/MocA family oxidoreductase, partial [Bacillota bacterium]|nr:Gfo/Idh/MocA family oxidoreductase [Bacillota bacterium]